MTHHFDVVAGLDVFVQNGASYVPRIALVCHSRAPQHGAGGVPPAPLDTRGGAVPGAFWKVPGEGAERKQPPVS
jgi:hypothetical protein